MDSLDRLRWIEEAAEALVKKMDEIHANDSYQGIWTTALIHGNPYRGPNYEKELEKLKTLLTTETND